MVAVPEALASALVMAGTSLAAERGTVKVVVVLVPCGEGVLGFAVESEHPTARMPRPTMSADIRYILVCLLESLRRISGRG
jgi:hypothetical protein